MFRSYSDDFPTTADCIEPRLYLSNYSYAQDATKLSRLGVTHVVSVLDTCIRLPDFIKGENKLHIWLPDVEEADILNYFDLTTSFINAVLKENPTNVVLVHCKMGVNRSATVVCAYLIAKRGMKAQEAVEYVQSKRFVDPVPGFRRQLETYAMRFESEHKEQN